MADEASSSNDEVQVTFNVKSSSDAKYVLTVPASMTVSELKEKLSTSEYADIPPSRQRLIYSGRVLKDPDTLGSYKIKDGNTVHLVKGAESNQRQDPAHQGGAAPVGSGAANNPAGNVPTNIAAGTGANNPMAQLTGARYAGMHGLPGMDMFGADGGMGAPPDPEQLLRILENPNMAQQLNEAMNNPAVIDMMRQNPMMRNNPMAQQVLENPELRRMMFDPAFIRMQMNMQRQMGGGGLGGAGGNFPAPGVTDTTQGGGAAGAGGQQNTGANAQQNSFGMFGGPSASGANPFAALFGGNPGAAQGSTPAATPPVGSTGQGTPAQGTPGVGSEGQQNAQQNPFANLFGGMGGAGAGGQGDSNPMAEMTRTMMQNPEMMRNVMQMMGGMGGQQGAGGAEGQNNPFAGGFNPMAFGGGFGGMGQQQPQQPADTRPPEERYAEQLRQLNDMGFYEFERNIRALRMSGGSVQGAVEHLLGGGGV